MVTILRTRFVVRFSYLLTCLFLLWLPGCGGNVDVAPTTAAPDPTSVDVPSEARPSGEGDASIAKPDDSGPVVDRTNETPVEPATAESSTEPPSESVASAPALGISKGSPESAETLAADATPTEVDTSPTPSDAGKGTAIATAGPNAAARLEGQLAAFTIPPAWLASVRPKWSTSKPWKEARQEIRNLLGKGDDASRREGIKLTWDYLQKDDIGDGHEYGMYMFLGGEPLWAIHVYREWLAKDDHSYPPYFGVKALAALYTQYGVFSGAEQVLEKGLTFKSPDPKWNEVRAAEINDAFGDLYAAWGKIDRAKTSYQEAARLFPLGKPPYGKHLLPRKAKKVQAKLDLLSKASLDGASLRDGQYREISLGYSGDVQLVVQVKGGRMVNVRVTKHEEKIDQNACVLIPQRMGDAQSLQVDGVSGATVTRDAIVSGTLSALKKAGLR
jgi:uncharacterized protein with FMN-binding domain